MVDNPENWLVDQLRAGGHIPPAPKAPGVELNQQEIEMLLKMGVAIPGLPTTRPADQVLQPPATPQTSQQGLFERFFGDSPVVDTAVRARAPVSNVGWEGTPFAESPNQDIGVQSGSFTALSNEDLNFDREPKPRRHVKHPVLASLVALSLTTGGAAVAANEITDGKVVETVKTWLNIEQAPKQDLTFATFLEPDCETPIAKELISASSDVSYYTLLMNGAVAPVLYGSEAGAAGKPLQATMNNTPMSLAFCPKLGDTSSISQDTNTGVVTVNIDKLDLVPLFLAQPPDSGELIEHLSREDLQPGVGTNYTAEEADRLSGTMSAPEIMADVKQSVRADAISQMKATNCEVDGITAAKQGLEQWIQAQAQSQGLEVTVNIVGNASFTGGYAMPTNIPTFDVPSSEKHVVFSVANTKLTGCVTPDKTAGGQ